MILPLARSAHDHDIGDAPLDTVVHRLGQVVYLLVMNDMEDIGEPLPVLFRDGVAIAHDGVGCSPEVDKLVGSPIAADDERRVINVREG